MFTTTTFFEALSVFLFLAAIATCLRRRDGRAVACIVSGSIFGLLLEYLNVILFDTYTYSPLFIIQVFEPPNNIPICIALCWGLIIYSSMKVSDRIGLPTWSRPFLDALLALTLDLSIDAIAIRLDGGFWTWTGIPMDSEFTTTSFFGVHYGNFVGWFFVVLIFSALLRFEERILHSRLRVSIWTTAFFYTVLPLIGYYLLYHAIVLSPLPVVVVNDLFIGADIDSNLQLACMLILGYLVGLALLTQAIALRFARRGSEGTPDWIPAVTFAFFHVAFLFFYMKEGFLAEAPLLLPIGLVMTTLDLGAHWIVFERERGSILETLFAFRRLQAVREVSAWPRQCSRADTAVFETRV
jgi:hypothetical protein